MAELAEVAVDVFTFITSEESLVVVKCKAHRTTAEVRAVNIRCWFQLPKLCHCRCRNTHVAAVLRVAR